MRYHLVQCLYIYIYIHLSLQVLNYELGWLNGIVRTTPRLPLGILQKREHKQYIETRPPLVFTLIKSLCHRIFHFMHISVWITRIKTEDLNYNQPNWSHINRRKNPPPLYLKDRSSGAQSIRQMTRFEVEQLLWESILIFGMQKLS